MSAGALLASQMQGEERERISRGDVAILRFLAAAEIIDADVWQQYNELAGVQDDQVPGGGNELYTLALSQLDDDMPQYSHDNTQDEMTHELFIHAYLRSKGAEPVDLDKFRTLPSSQAPGSAADWASYQPDAVNGDTSRYTRYRDARKNPDFGNTFPPAVPDLAVGRHTAIPRTDDDVKPDNSDSNGVSDFTQAIANTAGFHFAFIEQGGISLYAMLVQRVSNVEGLRIPSGDGNRGLFPVRKR